MEDIIKTQYRQTIEMLGDTVEQKNARIKDLETENKALKEALQEIERVSSGAIRYLAEKALKSAE